MDEIDAKDGEAAEGEEEEEEEEENEKDLNKSVKNKKKKKSKKKKKLANAKEKENEVNLRLHESRASIFIIKNEVDKGRCAIASQELNEGVCILKETPFAFVSFHESLCELCGEVVDKKNGEPYLIHNSAFCNIVCYQSYSQLFGLSIEDLEVKLSTVAKSFDCSYDLLKIVYRIMIKLRHQRDIEDLFNDNGEVVTSNRLGFLGQEDHLPLQSASWKEALINAFIAISAFQEVADWSPTEALRCASIVNTNSFGISTSTNYRDSKGFGVFSLAGTCFNHSCNPNVLYIYNQKGWMEFRTLRPIKKGEELCINYIDIFESTNQRRKLLLETRFFYCRCDRCKLADILLQSSDKRTEDLMRRKGINELSLEGYVCRTCGSGSLINLSHRVAGALSEVSINNPLFRCLACDFQFNDLDVNSLNIASNSWKQVNENLNYSSRQGIAAIEKWLAEFTNFSLAKVVTPSIQLDRLRKNSKFCLSPTHVLVIKAKLEYAYQLNLIHESLKSLELYKEAVSVLEDILPPNYPDIIALQQDVVSLYDSILSKNLPKKTHAGYLNDKQSLQKKVAHSRLIAYGL